MPELTTETIRRVDTTHGTATALPTDQEFTDYWRMANANVGSAIVAPDVPDAAWAPYADESAEWAQVTLAAGAETWPKG